METVETHIKEMRTRAKNIAIMFSVLFVIGVSISGGAINTIQNYIDFGKYNILLVTSTPFDALLMYVTFALSFAFALTTPYAIYNTIRFVEPIFENNKKTNELLLISMALFSVGCFFGFYFLKYMLLTSAQFSFSSGVTALWNMNNAVSLFIAIPLLFSVLFQIPLLLSIFDKTKMIPFDLIKSQRGKVIIAILLISGLITPSGDAVSQVALSIPMYGLFEFTNIINMVW